ncbi:MAG: response regulator [Bacteroidetes bacterium]|nr:response regulator [Bacteroidota bacterium]
MNILIIEDEHLAARRLENMIHEYDPSIKIVAQLESVTESVEWFRNNPAPDLIFLDIHLEDNVSFAIFNQVTISSPFVFTTATDQKSTREFEVKKIDYLLKPIIQKELVQMIEKYRKLPLSERKVVDAETFRSFMNCK